MLTKSVQANCINNSLSLCFGHNYHSITRSLYAYGIKKKKNNSLIWMSRDNGIVRNSMKIISERLRLEDNEFL